MPEQNRIGLRELIDKVKAELCEPHSNPIFTVDHVDLEISLTAERDIDGKVNLRVIEGGAAKKSTAVQVVKLALKPKESGFFPKESGFIDLFKSDEESGGVKAVTTNPFDQFKLNEKSGKVTDITTAPSIK